MCTVFYFSFSFYVFVTRVCRTGGWGGSFGGGKKRKSLLYFTVYTSICQMKQKKKKKETQVSPPPAHAVQEKIHFLISLPTLSNQDRDLHKGVLLSAPEYTESSILLFAAVHEQWR